MKKEDRLCKIAFEISDEGAGFEIERLWAKSLGDDLYVIDNSPFHVFGISVGDTVTARKKNAELAFLEVVKRGGHSTYRVKLPLGRDHSYFLRYWSEIAQFGCTYEGASGDRRLYAIDIPDPLRVADVYSVLQKNEDANIWEFEEAHYFKPERS